jgi:hypothetical protein
MSEAEIDTPTDPDEEELGLTGQARIEITLGTQFTYRGNSHWPKVAIADGPQVLEQDDGSIFVEDGESLLYRVTELSHRTLAALVARMKHEIDERYENDQAARTGATPPS